MAEINIEKKNNNNNKNNKLVWILVLFLFLLVGIFWWIGSDYNEPEVDEGGAIEQPTSGTTYP